MIRNIINKRNKWKSSRSELNQLNALENKEKQQTSKNCIVFVGKWIKKINSLKKTARKINVIKKRK